MNRSPRIFTRRLATALAATGCTTLAAPVFSQSNIDPAHQSAWQENCGWLNWRDADGGAAGVVTGVDFLSGYIWAENVGWINVGDGTPAADCDGNPCYDNIDGTDFGINVDSDGSLRGLAWGENTGWINFDTLAALGPYQQEARLNLCDNTLAGYAWGENIGWINLDDATHFVALGPDCAPGDVACDGVIGLADYSAFEAVLTGPDVLLDCPAFDSDADSDVDLRDFAVFQTQFTG
jgi:hypothetical protein